MGRSSAKRSQHELKRLVEQAVTEECGLRRRGLWLCVERVEVVGHPPEKLNVWATLHFLPAGSPFCCGEPECHLGLNERGERIGERLRKAMLLRHPVTVDLGDRIGVNYHAGVTFTNTPSD
jgi:hypothetical protein